MNVNKLTLKTFPRRLQNIPSPPKKLYVLGGDLAELLAGPAVAVVGSRKLTPYGKSVTHRLTYELARQGVVIISGLALGVDGVAHRAALEAGGKTIAVLPGPVEQIYPRAHYQLAQQILRQGGALISEYPAGMQPLRHTFIARNRLVSGLADALLITEAAEKSGTLHTARFALEQGRDVMAVPGNITSPTSAGCNNLLKAGAHPVTSAEDVLYILGVESVGTQQEIFASNDAERIILQFLREGIADGDELQLKSQLDITLFSETLTMLELTGKIRALGGNQWTLR